jgi:hypothetical protein
MEQETAILITGLQQHKAGACQRLLATYGEMVFRMVQRIVTCRENVFNLGQEQTQQEPVVAQTAEQPTVSVSELVEGEPAEASELIAEKAKPAKKQRKVTMKLVELIPTSEAESANTKELPAAVIDKIKVYDKLSNPSTLTGIDDTDPLIVMAAQIEEIRSRGQQLHIEITELINN